MPTTDFEARLWAQGFGRIMGLDEVGRGCLAGPVVAAGVIFHPDRVPSGIDDSKKLSPQRRAELVGKIRESALYSIVAESDVAEIGRLNILWASLKAMTRCAESVGADPDYLLVDGNRYVASLIPYTCVVRGDARSVSIAAASILAKEHRDDLMRRLHEAHPQYGWDRNVGYPTADHRRALAAHGPTPWHREGFRWQAP